MASTNKTNRGTLMASMFHTYMNRTTCLRASRRTSGQALIETMIVMPIMVFVILGGLQIIMLQHGRIMTQYAAYNAARAGIVHNANWNVMQNAALIGVLPLYHRTDSLEELGKTWLIYKGVSEASQAVDMVGGNLEDVAGDLLGVDISGLLQNISLVEIQVLSPDENAFKDSEQWQRKQEQEALRLDPKGPEHDPGGPLEYPTDYKEIDFDDQMFLKDHPEAGRLAIEVRVLVPLKIPIVNRMIFDLYLASQILRTRQVRSNLQEWLQYKGTITKGGGLGQDLHEAVSNGSTSANPIRLPWMRELATLSVIAENFNYYFIPVRATYAMQMQSNPFEENQQDPSWFGGH